MLSTSDGLLFGHHATGTAHTVVFGLATVAHGSPGQGREATAGEYGSSHQ